MPYHVEIRGSVQRAWAFNVEYEDLRRSVLEPWRSETPMRLGEKEWEPRRSSLRILEGPRLEAVDLSMGRGWGNAERSARDVTRELLVRVAADQLAVAVLATSPQAEVAAEELLEELGVASLPWPQVRARMLAANSDDLRGPTAVGAALLIVDSDPDPAWLFDAGLALGRLRKRAVLVLLGKAQPPAALADVAAIELEPGRTDSARAMAERLGQLGLPL